VQCATCGASSSGTNQFCVGCGLPMRALATGRARRSLSEQGLADEAHAVVSASEGERKQVTVLFADLGASLGAIGGVDAEEAEAMLDAVVDIMVEAVHRFEGTVNQLLGDGIMALFGAPIAHEDHAVRAACAALAMQASLRRLRSRSWQARGLTPEIRVGLNSGEAIVRSVRGDLGTTYRAIGSTTHLAARMEQLAPRGSIRLTEEVMRMGRGMLRVRALGATIVKGLSEPIETFELTGVTTRTRFQATIARGLSPFVGRAGALAALKGALADPLNGRQRSVIVSGEPGIGKSRLCHEVLRSPEASTFRVLEASALSYARGSPHALLAALVKSMCEIDDEDGPEEVRGKVHAQLAALGLGSESSTVVLELLDLPTGSQAWRQLEPVQRLRKIEHTVRELLRAWCGANASIVLLEDLHWADPDSLSFIWGLFEAPPPVSLLLIGTLRPEPASPRPELPGTLLISLGPLPLEESTSLVRSIVGSDESLGRLRRQVAEDTQGNPLFIEEGAKALLELGPPENEDQQASLGKNAEPLAVPPAVEALIATRLDRLHREGLRLLQAAAVIGDDSPLEVLRAVADADEATFFAWFTELASADLLYQTGPFRAPVFRFRHALLREVAARRMLRSHRRSLHGRVVEAFERLYPTRLAEHWERLAEHASEAEHWAKSARYHQRACARAVSRRANARAIAHLGRGIEVSMRIEPSLEREQIAVDLRLMALGALLPTGDHDRIISHLYDAEASARELRDPKRIAKVLAQLGTALWHTSRYDAALEAAERARSHAAKLGDFSLMTAASHCVGMIHHARGNFGSALEALEGVVASLAGPVAVQQLGWAGYPSIFARTFVISCHTLQGRFAEAERVFEEARSLASAVDHPYSWTMLLEEYGFCQLLRGEFEHARQLCESAAAFCQEGEVLVMYAPTAARLGAALTYSGRAEAAKALIADAFARGTQRCAGHYGVVFLWLAQSDALLHTGELAQALESAERAEEATRLAGEHAYHVSALIQLGDVLLAASETRARAGAVYERALEEARALGTRPFEALALEGKARWLWGRGESERADACFTSADALWCTMNASGRRARLAELRCGLAAPGSAASAAPA